MAKNDENQLSSELLLTCLAAEYGCADTDCREAFGSIAVAENRAK